MHRIIDSYLANFSRDYFIEDEDQSKQFEFFVNYCLAYERYPGEIDFREITSDSPDSGIDGVIFIVDDELITTIDEIKKVFSTPKKNIPINILFVQSKTSDSYNLGEVYKFCNGVEDFLSQSPKLPHGDFLLSARLILDCIIDNVAKVRNGRPNCQLFYVTTSDNTVAAEIDAARINTIQKIKRSNLFNDVSFEYLGFEELMKLWTNINNVTHAELTVQHYFPFTQMSGISESYMVLVSAQDFINNILLNSEGKIKLHIFEENVRAFLGQDNYVNEQIRKTLQTESLSDKFAILNNGITIISPDVRVQSNKISLENYQIVNGCQTSNILFDCLQNGLDNVYITVKIIEAEDADVISEIVRATNSQSKVDENQFLSFKPFIRKLEKYFDATQDIDEKEVKLYFERQLGQYKNTDIPRKKVFSITETGRSLGALFLLKPDLASRYPNKYINETAEVLFNDNNKESAFYSAALVDYKLRAFYQKNKILNKYAKYKWHIITIFGYLASGITPPSIQKKRELSTYTEIINGTCCDEEKLLNVVEKIPSILNAIGLKENRDEVRSAAYAKQVLEYCNKNLLKK